MNPRVQHITSLAWAVGLVASTTACRDAELPTCIQDSECRTTEICHERACTSTAEFECRDGRSPAVTVEPSFLEMGQISSFVVRKPLTIANVGDCELQLVSFEMASGTGSRFSCVDCELGLPVILYPGRSKTIEVAVGPGEAGLLEDELVVQSSDEKDRYLRVRLSADSLGLPHMTVVPESVDFGFVPPGTRVRRVVSVVNTGLGASPLFVSEVSLSGADRDRFSLVDAPGGRVEIAPSSLDASARLDLTIELAPTDARAHLGELLVKQESGAPVTVHLSSLADPPDLEVSLPSIDFGAAPLGQSVARNITLQNTGRAPLLASARVESSSSDLVLLRAFSASIEPGAYVQLGLVFNPTVVGTVTGTLVIQSNDPTETEVRIPLVGVGEALPPGNEVVAVEMRFQNSSNSFLDQDIRDVDLILESPVGAICREDTPSPTWGSFGSPRWTAAPPEKNPERIILSGAQEDGDFPVLLTYLQDCASLPTALTALVLGIGVTELGDYLSDGSVAIDGVEFANAVEETCVQRKSAGAHLVVTINGAPVYDQPVQLSSKGDFATPVVLRRQGSVFSVVPR